MLKVKLFTNYGKDGASALVEQYGREFSVMLDEAGEVKVFRTNPNQYERRPAWQIKADVKSCSDFIIWAHNTAAA